MLCAKFGKYLTSGSGEDDGNVKSLQTDGCAGRQQAIRKAHFELKILDTTAILK